MKLLKKSENGKVIMVARSTGIAVSVQETVWNATGRVMLNEWSLKASGLALADAEELFMKLAA